MEVRLRNNRKVFIREYEDRDFHLIQALNKREGWTNLAVNSERTKIAWEHSGETLLCYVQQLYPNARIDLLATRTSRSFYEKLGFRHFAGFRRTKG